MSIRPSDSIDKLLDPAARCFNSAVAREVADFRIGPEIESRLEKLQRKASKGVLSPDEKSEHEALVESMDLIAALQAKSKRVLQTKSLH